MDTALLSLLAIGLLPPVLLTLLRVNAATAFLALCLGSVLGVYVGESLVDVLRGFIAPASDVTHAVVGLALLWLPVLLVLFFMGRTIGHKQRLLNLLPAIGVGLVGILLSVPFFTAGLQVAVGQAEIWRFVHGNSALIVTVSTLVSLFLLRMRAPLHDHAGKHH